MHVQGNGISSDRSSRQLQQKHSETGTPAAMIQFHFRLR